MPSASASLGVDAAEGVDAGVDHQAVPRRLAQGGDPLRLLGDRPHGAGGVVGVLEVAADRAGVEQPARQLGAGQAVARLGVDGHRDAHRLGDARGGGEHLVGGRLLAVGEPERGGHGDRTGRHDREPGGLDELRGVGVPRVRQHQRLARNVQRLERGGAHASRFGSGVWLVMVIRFQLLIAMTSHATARYCSSVNTRVASS